MQHARCARQSQGPRVILQILALPGQDRLRAMHSGSPGILVSTDPNEKTPRAIPGEQTVQGASLYHNCQRTAVHVLIFAILLAGSTSLAASLCMRSAWDVASFAASVSAATGISRYHRVAQLDAASQ